MHLIHSIFPLPKMSSVFAAASLAAHTRHKLIGHSAQKGLVSITDVGSSNFGSKAGQGLYPRLIDAAETGRYACGWLCIHCIPS